MTSSPHARRLVRWYPRAWRERYGEEFAALLEDTLDGGTPSVRLRLDVIRSALAMRLREAGLPGRDTRPDERIRSGALIVLCAWSVFVVAGIGLQRTSEHWEGAVSGSAHAWASIAFAAVQVLAFVASLLVVAGALAVVPAAATFLAGGGWSSVRRPVIRAAATCGLTAVAFVALVGWAHRLSDPQRNGTDLAYGLAVLGGALLVMASIATVTAAGVQIVRRLGLSPRIVRLEGHLAEGVAAAMVLMAVAAGIWWGVVATAAPSFFGAGVGGRGPGADLQIIVVGALMVMAIALGAFGARRVSEGNRRTA